jgi:hypothetical protein
MDGESGEVGQTLADFSLARAGTIMATWGERRRAFLQFAVADEIPHSVFMSLTIWIP